MRLCLTSLLIFALSLLQKVIMFNIQPDGWFSWLELVIFSAIIISFIWLSLFIAFHQPDKRRNYITAAISLLVLAHNKM